MARLNNYFFHYSLDCTKPDVTCKLLFGRVRKEATCSKLGENTVMLGTVGQFYLSDTRERVLSIPQQHSEQQQVGEGDREIL